MQHDHILKKVEFWFQPPTLNPPRGSNPGQETKILSDMVILILCLHAKVWGTILKSDLVIAKLEYLTFDPA